jgi:hypothetical protein
MDAVVVILIIAAAAIVFYAALRAYTRRRVAHRDKPADVD